MLNLKSIVVICLIISCLYCQAENIKTKPYIIGKFTVPAELPRYKSGFVNTGLAYDTKRDILIFSHYRSEHKDESIEFLDKTGKRVKKPLPVGHFASAVQGLAYDSSDDTLWIWGTGTENKQKRFMIWHCDMTGKKIGTGIETKYMAGMLAYDPKTDSIWLNPYNSPILFRISCKTGKIEEELKPGRGLKNSEGIALDPFDGTFWLLNKKSLYHVKQSNGKYELIKEYPNPSHNYPDDIKDHKVAGNDWSFKKLEGKGKVVGEIYKKSGGITKAALKPGNKIIVKGSAHNDKIFKIVKIDDKSITVHSYGNSKINEEPPGREILIQKFNRGEDEGVAVDPKDHTIWMNSDQFTHGATPEGNRCWHVDPLGAFPDENAKIAK